MAVERTIITPPDLAKPTGYNYGVRVLGGATLYIADMARFLMEHPRWVSADRLARLDVRAGEGLGRIWRVVRSSRRAPRRASSAESCRLTVGCERPRRCAAAESPPASTTATNISTSWVRPMPLSIHALGA